MPARIDDLLVLNANLNKSDFAKYPRDREAVLPNDFGGLGDGVADDRTAIQAAFDRAEADQKFAMIPPGTWNVSGTVTLPSGARGLIMQGTIRYTGTAPTSVLVLGDGGTTSNATFTVATDTTLDVGDRLTITAPSPGDATLADVFVTLRARFT